ncbi:MAG: hypothetical protein K2I75_06500, partial [Clostridiales bacterium]|nr:hypothetical protein [Clostridiales bacterium]
MIEDELFAYQSSIIGKILEAPFDVALQIYTDNFNILQDYNFILPCSDGIDYVQKFRDMNLKDIDVIHFFESEKLYCIKGPESFADLFNDDYQFKIASRILLDTQIMSYLYRNYKDSTNKIPNNIDQIKKII